MILRFHTWQLLLKSCIFFLIIVLLIFKVFVLFSQTFIFLLKRRHRSCDRLCFKIRAPDLRGYNSNTLRSFTSVDDWMILIQLVKVLSFFFSFLLLFIVFGRQVSRLNNVLKFFIRQIFWIYLMGWNWYSLKLYRLLFRFRLLPSYYLRHRFWHLNNLSAFVCV